MDNFLPQLLEVLTISSYVLFIVGPLLICVAFLTYLERKVIAAVQYRKGPNVVGMFGLLQPFADGVKLFSKETIIPASANKIILLILKFNDLVISETFNGPWFLKKGLDIIAFTKANQNTLSIIIAIYFLSTIVADQIASAIFFSSTKASPLYFQTLPCDLIASIFKIKSQSGITGFLNLAFSTPIRKTNLFSYVALSSP